jgi:hypothetical protein
MTGLKKYRSYLVPMLVVLGAAGCGGSLSQKTLYQVQGRVLVNGEPDRFVSVELTPEETGKGLQAEGHTDADGRFQLRTYSNEEPDGVAAGTYKVQVQNWNIQRYGAIPTDAKPTTISPEVTAATKVVEISGQQDDLVIEIP